MINRYEKAITLTDRIHNSYENIIKIYENKLSNKLDKIILLNPFNIMKKGYGIVYNKNVITSSIKQINLNDEVEIRMSDGSFNAIVKNINKEN
jgi:exonuclease VII large subunit